MLTLLLGIGLLLPPAAYGWRHETKVTYDISSQLAPASEPRRGFRVLDEHFGIGEVNPTTVLLIRQQPATQKQLVDETKQMVSELYQIDGVRSVRYADDPLGDFPPDGSVGVFSNLTGDHLDYHGTMERYAAAKARLFAMLPPEGTAIVNRDDPWHEAMLRDCRAPVLRCSVGQGDAPPDPAAACTAHIHESRLGWQDTSFRGPWGDVRTRLPLVGRHNAMNALQAAAAASAIGVPPEAIRAALGACAAPPGRLEPVTVPDDPFAVLVDYAHTDDALLNVLTALRPLVGPGGNLVTVFGCGGDRDRTKRPRMMRVACERSDRVVVTSDNPRTEDPEAIIDEVMAGRPAGGATSVARQVDRARAIGMAVGEARPGDIVLIAGKGHEDYQVIGTRKTPFDDRIVAREALGRGTVQVAAALGR